MKQFVLDKRLAQQPAELAAFAGLVRAYRCESYLEIGARYGYMLDYMAREVLPSGSKVVAVDLPNDVWGRRDSYEVLCKIVADLKRDGYDAHLITGDSKSPEIVAAVKALAPFDVGFIDGDHSLAGVTQDCNNYRKMCGMLGFHDINGVGQKCKKTGRSLDVPQAWERLKKEAVSQYKESIDLVTDGKRMGIGVLLPRWS